MNAKPFRARCLLARQVCLTFALAACCTGLAIAGTFPAANSSEIRALRAKVRAVQFLSKTTFGPTKQEVDALAMRIRQIGTRRACEEWIDQQFAMQPTLHRPTLVQMMSDHGLTHESDEYIDRYRYHAFYHNAIAAPDQLQQRVAWALSQIFVINDLNNPFSERQLNPNGLPNYLGPSDYYDKMLLGVKGNYRQTLEDVAMHPIMGMFLSHIRNRKADPANNRFPDENFAREIMQLFSIGLHELHSDGRPKLDADGNLIPTYDNETIRNFARVFTGLTYSQAQYFGWGDPRDFISPMEMWPEHHDVDEKTLLRGMVLPAHSGTRAECLADIQSALDNLADHENVPPFISRLLIQRLVRSNPSRGYLRRVSRVFANNGRGVRGDMKAVVKAILLDAEAFRSIRTRRLTNPLRVSVTTTGTEFSRLQEPMLHQLAMVRTLQPTSYYNNTESRWYMMDRTQDSLGQSPFGAPSVFNFYLPSYQPPGPLATTSGSRRLPDPRIVAPEFQMMTAVRANQVANHFRWQLYNGRLEWSFWSPQGTPFPSRLQYDFDDWISRIDEEPEQVVDELNWLFCRGTLEDSSKQAIIDSLQNVTAERPWIEGRHRFGPVILFVVSSPECMIAQ